MWGCKSPAREVCALACAGSQGEGRGTDQLLAVGILFKCECVTGLEGRRGKSDRESQAVEVVGSPPHRMTRALLPS